MELYDLVTTIYPDSPPLDLKKLHTPKDLVSRIKALASVERFNDPTHIDITLIPDNTMVHTQRIVWRARHVFPSAELERFLWVHDIAEAISGDVSAVSKIYSKELDQANKVEELAAARQLMHDDDFYLYIQSEVAKDYLYAESDQLPEFTTGLVGKLIDHIDGNLVFHYYASKEYREAENPRFISEGTAIYTRQKFEPMYARIMAAKGIDNSIKEACLKVLEDQIRTVLVLWKDNTRFPASMEHELNIMRGYEFLKS